MKRYLISSICFFVTGLFTQAALAADTLDGLAAQLQKQGAFHCEVSQEKQVANFKRPLRAKGYIVFEPGSALLYALDQPVQARYRMQQDRIEAKEGTTPTRVMTSADLPWLNAITAIFTGVMGGDITLLRQYFDLQLTPGTHWQLHLLPKAGPLQKALKGVQVDGELYIEHIDVIDSNGAHIVMTLSAPLTPSPADLQALKEAW